MEDWMRIALIGLGGLASLAAAMPASAQEQMADPAAKAAIVQGNYDVAERRLLQELRIYPGRPELLLNLAAVYSKTGRYGEARNLYQRVLTQDDVLMDLSADQTAGSHALAQTGLRRLDFTTATARR
jgi:tetratricopeptide (TPR) repeat protein